MKPDNVSSQYFRFEKSRAGFTIIELLIVMVIFIIVIMISANAFDKILSTSTRQVKSSESNIQGIVGLEIMRSDLERVGYGLPWCQSFVADFAESGVSANFLANGISPSDFNDTSNPTKNETFTLQSNMTQGFLQGPRAIQSKTASGANAWENGRDYLVIKSASVGMNAAAKKWSYLENTGTVMSPTWAIKQWGAADDFIAGDRVITLDSEDHRLVGTSSTFSYALSGSPPTTPNSSFVPDSGDQNFLLYGVSASSNLSFPYNRVDYYIKRPADIPARCANGTGILYKANLNQTGGGVTQYPLLDCVADMQVLYGLDTLKSGRVEYHCGEDCIASLTSEQIRAQLKEIKILILAHEGDKDKSYTHPTNLVQVGDTAQGGRQYDLSQLDSIGTDWKYYRWKVYTIVARPRNLSK